MLTSRKFYETAYSALMPELTLDYDERTKLSTFRMLLGTVGDISGRCCRSRLPTCSHAAPISR